MKKKLIKFLIALLLVVGLGLLYLTNTGILSYDRPYVYRLSSESPADAPLATFVNVNVIPMDSERVLANQTVIISGGVIQSVGESTQVRVPDGGLVIDGSGKYLMPGLVDMHVHIESENDLILLIANGVTGIRNMWGNTDKKLWFGLPDQLKLRQQIAQGRLFGPTIYTSGPVMEGSPPNHPLMEVFQSPEAARQSVVWQATQGYDFIKVYDHLSPEVYQAVIRSAHENNIPVAGHVPFTIGLDGVLANGQQTIEHLTGYINPDTVEFIIPEAQLHAYAEKTLQAGVWNCVTLSEYPKSKETPEGFERLQNQPGMIYVSPGMRLFSPLMYYGASKSHTYPRADYPEKIAALNRQMVQALHDAGAGILLGTDAAQAYHIPGFSIHEELAYLVDAGLSPFEALETGTLNAAAAIGKSKEFGTVAVDKRADLILLQQNPLDNVAHVRDRAGVMVRGKWLSETELQSMLGGLVSSYNPNLFERLWPLLIIALAVFLGRRKTAKCGIIAHVS